MRSIIDMDTVQIEITNACRFSCSNCTRFCGHQRPYFMTFEQFKEAVDSMEGYPKMVGIMGGEPLLHPEFEKFCRYALSKFPKEKLGLWTTFPEGFEHYRIVICETFQHIFLNDHTRDDVYHSPVLVAIKDIIPDKNLMFHYIDHCWAQESWSASINPNGAFFCEIAASLSILFGGPKGWKVEPGWWWKTPKDFKEQIEQFCPNCGLALNLPKRPSQGTTDDISPSNFEKIKDKSFKILRNDFQIIDQPPCSVPMGQFWQQTYKDLDYRSHIADRYGIFLVRNEQNFISPYLKKNWTK